MPRDCGTSTLRQAAHVQRDESGQFTTREERLQRSIEIAKQKREKVVAFRHEHPACTCGREMPCSRADYGYATCGLCPIPREPETEPVWQSLSESDDLPEGY